MAEQNRQRIVARYEELGAAMLDPQVLADPEHYLRLVKEHAALEELAQAIQAQEACLADIEVARELLSEAEQPEERQAAQAELCSLEAEVQRLEDLIQEAMADQDPRDKRDILLEIRAGAGGDEAALFAADLLQMYQAYAAQKQLGASVLDATETELGGYKNVVLEIQGQGAFSLYKYESGVHRVQRVPQTESGGRIHTSTCTVAVMPEVDEIDYDLNMADLRIDTYRASGAGGQHVNKTSSAIRITHLPTNTVVTCQDERSQHKNKDKALKVLRSKLLEMERSRQEEETAALRKDQVGTGDRSERIRTYNFPQSRVTDHRIGLTLYKLDGVLAGNLDDLVLPLREAEKAAQVEAQE